MSPILPRKITRAAHSAGQWAVEDGDHPTALRYLLTALDLLPKIIWLGLEQTTVLSHAVDWQDLARDVAASAIENDRPPLAVAVLERGRTIFWSQVTGFPVDTTRLRRADRDLSERLDRIGAQLAAARASATRRIGMISNEP